MKRLRDTLICVVVGAVCGAVAVGALAGIDTALALASDPESPERKYAGTFVLLAVVFGGGWGALLGFLVGVSGVSLGIGALVGAALGALTGVGLSDYPLWCRILAVPFTALLGWLVTWITRRWIKS